MSRLFLGLSVVVVAMSGAALAQVPAPVGGPPPVSILAFTQTGNGQNINPSAGGGSIATASGFNPGVVGFNVTNLDTSNVAYCRAGATAAATDQPVAPNYGQFFFPAQGQTLLSCYGNSTSLNVVPGSGSPAGTSGTGSSSGSITGTVTANAGTNLNTSALATQATLASVLTAANSIATNTGNFNDPCSYSKKSFISFSTATGTATNLISEVASQFVYICSIAITTSAQTNFSLIASTTTACGGSPYAVIGSTTAASGLLLGPGVSTAGGIAQGNGAGTIGVAGTAASYVCTLFTTTNSPTVSGTVGYVQTSN